MGYFYELMQSLKQKDSSYTHIKTTTHPNNDESVESAQEHVLPIQKQPQNVHKG